jgi:hypothetical protein
VASGGEGSIFVVNKSNCKKPRTVKYDGVQNTTILLGVIKQHVSAYAEAIFRFTKF